ncbi:MAG: A/G-specific adenine glycosylase [Candidatus Aminicenantes bacterium]|nr:A/G-specific adenine glycosylase [Candidatus Aminicenantes bacterium]
MAWYRARRRDLPWRRTRDPYLIWVSEVMLQQTTVPAVVPYFERWARVFPDLDSLARAPLRRVLREWQGLGYYQRARNLHRAAGLVLREHGGRVPDDEAALRRLPGFGPYTAAAVLSLAYGRPRPVIDANVRRVLMRVLGLDGPAGPRVDRDLRAFLDKVFPNDAPGDFNQGLMELGALVCRSRNPQCLACPVRFACRAAREGRQEVIPEPRRLRTEEIEAVVAVIERRGRFLIQERAEKGLLAGLWEFPGGKVEPGESPRAALRREVREEVGIEVRVLKRLATVTHAYTRFRVRLHAYLCALRDPGFEPGPRRRWVTMNGIRRYPLPSGSVKIVEALAGRD